MIRDLNGWTIARSKEVIDNMCFISKGENKNGKEDLKDE